MANLLRTEWYKLLLGNRDLYVSFKQYIVAGQQRKNFKSGYGIFI